VFAVEIAFVGEVPYYEEGSVNWSGRVTPKSRKPDIMLFMALLLYGSAKSLETRLLSTAKLVFRKLIQNLMIVE